MAWPTTGVLDNFNRAGPALGSNWSADNDNLVIVGSTQAYASGATNYSGSYWNPATFGPDSEVYYTIATKPANTEVCWMLLRGQSLGGASRDGYDAVFFANSGTDVIRINRVDNDTETQLGADVSQEFSNGDQFGMGAIGTSISVYRNGTSLASRTDSTYALAGNIMMGCYGRTVRIDDFGGGTTAAGTTHNGGAAMGAAGWMLAQTSNTISNGAGLGAAGWLSAQTLKTLYGGSGLGAAGWITADGQLVKFGGSGLGGAGWLSAESQKILYGGTGQGAAGYLNVETLKTLIGAAGLEAIGRMFADGTGTAAGTTHSGGASLDGHGWLSVIAERIAEGAAGLDGRGWLDVFGERVAQAAADLAGAGWLSAAGQRVSLGAIDLGAAGYVSLTATITHSASAQMGAAGYLSALVLVQGTNISAGNRTPYSPNDREAYRPEIRAGQKAKTRRIY